jgi:hypothetical protein
VAKCVARNEGQNGLAEQGGGTPACGQNPGQSGKEKRVKVESNLFTVKSGVRASYRCQIGVRKPILSLSGLTVISASEPLIAVKFAFFDSEYPSMFYRLELLSLSNSNPCVRSLNMLVCVRDSDKRLSPLWVGIKDAPRSLFLGSNLFTVKTKIYSLSKWGMGGHFLNLSPRPDRRSGLRVRPQNRGFMAPPGRYQDPSGGAQRPHSQARSATKSAGSVPGAQRTAGEVLGASVCEVWLPVGRREIRRHLRRGLPVRGQFLCGFRRESPARAVFSHTYKIPVLPRGSGQVWAARLGRIRHYARPQTHQRMHQPVPQAGYQAGWKAGKSAPDTPHRVQPMNEPSYGIPIGEVGHRVCVSRIFEENEHG